jgi:hypothetical protein
MGSTNLQVTALTYIKLLCITGVTQSNCVGSAGHRWLVDDRIEGGATEGRKRCWTRSWLIEWELAKHSV